MIHANLAVTLRPRLYTRQSSQNPKMTPPQHALMHPPIYPLMVSQKPVVFQDTAYEIPYTITPYCAIRLLIKNKSDTLFLFFYFYVLFKLLKNLFSRKILLDYIMFADCPKVLSALFLMEFRQDKFDNTNY